MSEATESTPVTEAPVEAPPAVSNLSRVSLRVFLEDDGANLKGYTNSLDVKTDYWSSMTSSGADPGELAAMLMFNKRFVKLDGRFYMITKVRSVEFISVEHNVQAAQS